MASKTPSNLYVESFGSMTAHIAEMSSLNSGDHWLSSITNIVAIFSEAMTTPSNGSTSGSSTTFTATNGTIFVWTGTNAAGARLLILSGSGYGSYG